MRKLIKIELVFDEPRDGSWIGTLDGDAWRIGGKPFPSEGQAWYFDKFIIPAIKRVCDMSQQELEEFGKICQKQAQVVQTEKEPI